MRAYFLRPALQPQAARRQPPAGPVISVLLGLAVSLGGCVGSFQWVKDGFSAHHAEAQFASCQLEAERLRYISGESDEERAARIHHEAGLCMKADGWRWVQSDGSAASESSRGEQAPTGRAAAAVAGGGSDAGHEVEADKSASSQGAATEQAGDSSAAQAGDKKEKEEEGDDDEDEDE